MTDPHDRTRCVVCVRREIDRLRLRGLHPRLVEELKDAGTACAEQIAVLLTASPRQIDAVNAAAAEYYSAPLAQRLADANRDLAAARSAYESAAAQILAAAEATP